MTWESIKTGAEWTWWLFASFVGGKWIFAIGVNLGFTHEQTAWAITINACGMIGALAGRGMRKYAPDATKETKRFIMGRLFTNLATGACVASFVAGLIAYYGTGGHVILLPIALFSGLISNRIVVVFVDILPKIGDAVIKRILK